MKNIILLLMLVVATSTQAQNTIGSYIGNKKEIKIKDKIFVTEIEKFEYSGTKYRIYVKNEQKVYESLERPKCPTNDNDLLYEFDEDQAQTEIYQAIKEIFSSERLKALGDEKHYLFHFLDQTGKTQYIMLYIPKDSIITPEEIYQLNEKLKMVRFRFIRDYKCFRIMPNTIRFSKVK